MEVEAKEREESLISVKRKSQREPAVQRFLLIAPCLLPTVHIVFLKVTPG